MVVSQHAAESLAAFDWTVESWRVYLRRDNSVFESLMISFAVIVYEKLLDCITQ